MASNAVGTAARGRFASTSWHQPIGPRSSRRTCTRRASAAAYAKQARFYFGLDPEASLDEIAAVAGYHPVFRVASRR